MFQVLELSFDVVNSLLVCLVLNSQCIQPHDIVCVLSLGLRAQCAQMLETVRVAHAISSQRAGLWFENKGQGSADGRVIKLESRW